MIDLAVRVDGWTIVLIVVLCAIGLLMWLHSDYWPPRYACQDCKARFPTFDLLAAHEEEQHGRLGPTMRDDA